jgi:kynureninase
MNPTATLQHCRQLDIDDPLRHLRDLFSLPPGVIYLDGNSLGALPKATASRVADVINREWGEGLIRSWNSAGWIDQPARLGDKIARLIGAGPGEVVATDSTSINLFKVLSVAMQLAARQSPNRKLVLSERSNFPTDLYMAEGLCRTHGFSLKLIDADAVEASLTPDVAVLMLTHVNYRTGAMFDMRAITRAARQAGVLSIWDLAHSAGAVPVDLTQADADFAVGCGYKFLNGGPGAPAFVWVSPRHASATSTAPLQPLQGWFGHAAPFAFTPGYLPAAGIKQYLCGTPTVLGMAALDCGLDTLLAAAAAGGMAALYAKSLALSDLFIRLIEERCKAHGIGIVTPLAHAARGSQVSLTCKAANAYAIMQALIARGVIGDFRAGDGAEQADILRFGFTPLYNGFEDVWHAVEALNQVLDSGEWKQPQFSRKNAVT